MKKALSIILSIIMVFVMCVPAFATKLTTEVPYEHTVLISYNEGGTVLVDGTVCPDGTQIKVDRFGEIDLNAIANSGYHLEKITINGVDVTSYYVDGKVKITNITDNVYIDFTFQKCADTPDDDCDQVAMTGNVYLGYEKLPNAELSFDLGNATTVTNSDGKYYVEGITEGRHVVKISKDGETLAHITFVIEFADVDEVTIRTAADGTQIVSVPQGTDLIEIDFHIVDSDNDGNPDQDPDITDPEKPENDPDDDNDGILDEDDPDHPNHDGDDDGISDKDDPDDDNDGILDKDDPDDDNDGIPDKDDPNHPDHDTDDDDIPDRIDPDDDNDGIPDKDDPDDDNDGIPDKDDPDNPDRDTDGDGIPDRIDKDDDNDGLPDGEQDWDDTDGDGIPDDEDPDDDNDNIPDDEDPDDDNDGYHDDYDGSEEGDLDNDGGIIDDGDEPGEIAPDIDIPDTSAERTILNPLLYIIIFGFMFFFIILIFFKRKKDEDDEIIVYVEE